MWAENGDEIVRAVVRQVFRNRAGLIGDFCAVMRAQVRTFDLDSRMRGLLDAGASENVLAVLDFMRNDTPEDEVRAPISVLEYARELAQRDIPVSTLLRAYRLGHARFTDSLMRCAVELAGKESVCAIIQLVNRTTCYADRVCEQVETVYDRERDRWVSSRSGRRRRWLAQVLAGSVTDVGRAEMILDYSLTGIHVAVTAWSDSTVSSHDAVTVLDDLRAVLSTVLNSSEQTLAVPTGEGEVRLWMSVPDSVEVDVAEIDRAVSAKALPVRVAIAEPAAGLAGFRRGMWQADRARAVAVIAGDNAPRVVSYPQVASIVLMVGDLERVRAFVAEYLGELVVNDQRNLWLRETLRVFLANNRSYMAAAQEMTVHRNTIQYRVQKALELAGHTFGHRERTLDLQLALHAAHWLGAAVLRSPPAG
ncbi:helix-turn-helix domain-containing protein [Nocardia sp. NPDC049190]|uniref:PucR family transcriptional regulator n=1 Tax=Nocardia sp. NPDC049190 TaxID=3155650 RepID=UPI0033D4550C